MHLVTNYTTKYIQSKSYVKYICKESQEIESKYCLWFNVCYFYSNFAKW